MREAGGGAGGVAEAGEGGVLTWVADRIAATCPACRQRAVDCNPGEDSPGCECCGASFSSSRELFAAQDAAGICATDLPDCGPAVAVDPLISRPICRRCEEEE